MKKFVSGLLVGFLLALPAFAAAEQFSMVGKKVQVEYPVFIDGEQLPVNAIAIDGTSYAPLRVVGEAIGYDVSFKNKKVIFESKAEQKEGGGVEENNHPAPQDQETKHPYTLENVDMAISGKESEINALLMMIGGAEDVGQPQERIDELRSRLAQAQQELEELKRIKAELEAQAK